MSVRDAYLAQFSEDTRVLEEEASRLNGHDLQWPASIPQGLLSKPRFSSDAQQIVYDGHHEAGTERRRIDGPYPSVVVAPPLPSR